MKSTTLMNALTLYLQTADCSSNGDLEDAVLAVKQLAAVQERNHDADLWHNEVFVITAWTLDNFLNFMTYDTYGKLAKAALPDKVPFSCYANNCRKLFGLDDLTDDALMLGYEIISDLWADNESSELHNADGTAYTAEYTAAEEDCKLEGCTLDQLKEYKQWFDSLMGPQATNDSINELYETMITITVAGKTISLEFDAENYNNVDDVLRRAIDNY